jgi:flagellar basal-body rod protein FlgG
MGDLIEVVGEILSRSQRRLEVSAQNIANTTTPGYKRVVNFDAILTPWGPLNSYNSSDQAALNTRELVVDFSPGKRIATGNLNDLAILGDGFFTIQGVDGPLYTRSGHFERRADGRLVTEQGYALQGEAGGDIVLKTGPFQVQSDGTILQAGEAIGRIAVADFDNPMAATPVEGGLFRSPEANVKKLETATIDQGALEASNVSVGAEMIAMMAALQNAHAGAKLASLSDDLMARAISTFGQA